MGDLRSHRLEVTKPYLKHCNISGKHLGLSYENINDIGEVWRFSAHVPEVNIYRIDEQ